MDASTVTSKGQVTIPRAIWRELGIGQGRQAAFASKPGKKLPADFDAASLLLPKPSREGRTRPAGKR